MSDDRDLVARLESLPEEAWTRPEPPAPPDIDAPAKRAPRRRRLTLSPVVAALAAIVLVVAGALGGAAYERSGGSSAGAYSASLAPIGTADPGASAHFALAGDGSTATLTVRGLQPAGHGHVYELWLMTSTSDLVSLGTFQVGKGGATHVQVPVPLDPRRYRYLDVSVQPLHGSSAHSDESVLRGRTRV
jgi:anti-sigma-K factor RskA